MTNGKSKDIFVDIEGSNERWSEYELEDGTVLRIRPVVVNVTRSENNYTPDGDPIYTIKAQIIVDPRVPDSLKKKQRT